MRLSGDTTGIPTPVRLALEAAGYVLEAAPPKHRRRFAKEAARLWGRKNPPPDGAVVKVAERLVRTQLIDAIHAAQQRGSLDLDWDDAEEGEVAITLGELLTILSWFFPDDYPAMLKPPAAVDAPPGSPAKIAAMATRAARGEGLYAAGDPDMASGGKRAKIVLRGNHTGQQVLGWEAEGEPVAVAQAAPVTDPLGWRDAPGW